MEAVFSNHTYLAKSAADYIELIERAQTENNIELANARKTFASTHTWENSVAEIYKAMQNHL